VTRAEPLRWRALALLGVPYVGFVAALVTRSLELDETGLRLAANAAHLGLRFGAAALGVGLLVALLLARDRLLHFVGYALYACALAAALGIGAVRALLNSAGGIGVDPAPAGPAWITVLFAAGAALSLVCIVALAAQIVAELRLDDRAERL
jgi:hypothetical protein